MSNADQDRYAEALRAEALLPQQLQPQTCRLLVLALEDSFAVLQGLGIPLRPDDRWHTARRHLLNVYKRNSFGSTTDELRRSSRAIFLANDLYVITRAFKGDSHPAIIAELASLFRGTLEETSNEYRGVEKQTQLWFGTLLAHALLHPAIPDSQGSRPDFVVTIDEIRLSVEVKRPRNAHSSIRALHNARNQLNAFALGLPGVIALDLSGVLHTSTQLRLPSRDEPVAPTDYRRQLAIEAGHLSAVISAGQPGRFNNIVALIAYARRCEWAHLNPPTLDFGFVVCGRTFNRARAGLIEHYAERFIDRFVPAVKRLTGNEMIRERDVR